MDIAGAVTSHVSHCGTLSLCTQEEEPLSSPPTEEYTKIQTPRQEVIFKKSSLDRKRDSIDQGSVTGSMTSGSGCSSTSGADQGSRSGAPPPDQVGSLGS